MVVQREMEIKKMMDFLYEGGLLTLNLKNKKV
jgi:hypothetical protein